MFPHSYSLILGLDLETRMEISWKLGVTLHQPEPGPLGAGVLHLVNPAITGRGECAEILDRSYNVKDQNKTRTYI